MDTTEAVEGFRDWVAAVSEDHPAPVLVQAVLASVEAPTIDGPVPASAGNATTLPAAALLDIAPAMVGLAASARTALALYDAHESWAGGVDDLESEQSRDLVARVTALATLAAGLDADPEQGLARLLDDPVGRALVTTFVAIEIVLARGTAFEPVEPGVVADDVAAMDDLVDTVLEQIDAAGGQGTPARALLPALLTALDDVADSLTDQIEGIAEAVRTNLPEQAGDRDGWQAEARDLRVYGLLAARMTAGAATTPAAAPTRPEPPTPEPPAPDLAPLRARLDETVQRRSCVTGALEQTRAQRASLQAELRRIAQQRTRPEPVVSPIDPVDPALQDAVAETQNALASAQEAAVRHAAILADQAPPTRGESSSGRPLPEARDAIRQLETDIEVLRQRIAAATEAQAIAAANQGRLSERLETMQARHAAIQGLITESQTRRTALTDALESVRKKRAEPSTTARASSKVSHAPSVRARAALRGAVLRARSKAVSARSDLAGLERARKAGPPPTPPPQREQPDQQAIQDRIATLETSVAGLRDRLADQLQARTNQVEGLKIRLAAAQDRRKSTAAARTHSKGQRKKLVRTLAAARKTRAAAAERPEPVAKEIASSITPEAREALDEAVFEAINRLHRARWDLKRALECSQTEQPKRPEAPEQADDQGTLTRARRKVERAEKAAATSRGRLNDGVAAQRDRIERIQEQRTPGTTRLQELKTDRAQLMEARETAVQAQADRRTKLEALVAPLPWPQDLPSEVQALRTALGTRQEAIAAARTILEATTARGAELPPPPDPQDPHVPDDLAVQRKAVVDADRAVQQAQARKAKMLAHLAEIRAPLTAKLRVLSDRKGRLDQTLRRFRKRRNAGEARRTGLQQRRAVIQDTLGQAVPELPNLTAEPLARRDAAKAALETARATVQEQEVAERVLRDTPPGGGEDPAPARETLSNARVLIEVSTAAVADVEARIARWMALTERRTGALGRREALIPATAKAREQRDALRAEQAALTAKATPVRAQLAAFQPAEQADDPSLVLLREVAQAAKEALEAARDTSTRLSSVPDPPTEPADRTQQLQTTSKRCAAAVEKLEAKARDIEQRRDQSYAILRREHKVALERARPTRKLQALRRRREALERARKTRAERRASLHTSLSPSSAADPALRAQVHDAAEAVRAARETLGGQVSAVAEARGRLSRSRDDHKRHEEALETIDESLARWTRRVRRADRAIQKLRTQIVEAGGVVSDPSTDPTSASVALEPAPRTDTGEATDLLDASPPSTPAQPPDDESSPSETLVDPPRERGAPSIEPELPALPTEGPPPPLPGLAAHSASPSSANPPPAELIPPAVPAPERTRDSASVEPPSVPPLSPGTLEDGTPPAVPSSVQSLLARIAAGRNPSRRPSDASVDSPAPPPLIPGIITEQSDASPTMGDPAATVPPPPDVSAVAPVDIAPALPETRAPSAPDAAPTDLRGAAKRSDISHPDVTPRAPMPMATEPDPPELDLDPSEISLPLPDAPLPAPPPVLSSPEPMPDLPPDPGLPPLPPHSDVVPDPGDLEDPSLPRTDPPSAASIGPTSLSNQQMHSAKTLILSRDELLKRAMLEDNDSDEDEEDDWSNDDGKTMLLSREEQIRRRDALIAERDAAPKRRRERWKPPSKPKK